jgi:hypothetical protein
MERESLMDDVIRQNFPLYFPLFFGVMWITVTTLLSVLSGWFVLMRTYPDREEAPLQSFSWQSGSMNRVSMRSILKLSPCPSGLRLSIMRLFGPFCRDFLVPWDEISVVRKDQFYFKVAQISFGRPAIGKLTIFVDVADRLARAAGTRWPETELVAEATGGGAASRIIKQWILSTVLAAAFFVIASRVILPKTASPPPILVCVLFPAIVGGFSAIVQYVRSQRP